MNSNWRSCLQTSDFGGMGFRRRSRRGLSGEEGTLLAFETAPAIFEAGDVVPVEIYSWRGEGAHFLQTDIVFDGGEVMPLAAAGSLSFDFSHENDACHPEGAAKGCRGHGLCFEATCTCDYGYSGDLCDQSACNDVVCLNGGTCASGVCACSAPWAGLDCGTCDETMFACLSVVELTVRHSLTVIFHPS